MALPETAPQLTRRTKLAYGFGDVTGAVIAGVYGFYMQAFLLDVAGMITRGELRISIQYSENVHRRETVERLAAGFLAHLRALIEHCLSPDAGGASPSDFPLTELDQATLDRLLQGQMDAP